jgi:hypothetical protein
MKRLAWFFAASASIACAATTLIESCGAMTFELPPEEPLSETVSPPRLMRHDGGVPEPGARHDVP